jgi:ribosome-associated protein
MTLEVFTLRGDHVTLGQLLKLTGVISSGGEAKLFLANSPVLVNGQPEQRRGRKIREGDLVEAPNTVSVMIQCDTDLNQTFDSGDVQR